MVESYTSTERVYKCDIGIASLREEIGACSIQILVPNTSKPEKVRELGMMLVDMATLMESL